MIIELTSTQADFLIKHLEFDLDRAETLYSARKREFEKFCIKNPRFCEKQFASGLTLTEEFEEEQKGWALFREASLQILECLKRSLAEARRVA